MYDKRAKRLNNNSIKKGEVIYWMSRDQRIDHNWALIYAQNIAIKQKSPFQLVFCLQESFEGAALRQYDFMLRGLKESFLKALEYKIPLIILKGNPAEILPKYIKNNDVGYLVTDFSPLKPGREWRQQVAEKVDIPVTEIDTHNIIPVWIASQKQEYSAATIRPKIERLLDEYLLPFPKLKVHPYNFIDKKLLFPLEQSYKYLKIDDSIKPVTEIIPGPSAAQAMLDLFISKKLKNYNANKNDPNFDVLSGLSPYLHFGQISAQETALQIKALNVPHETKKEFLEQLIIRRELAENFCFYNQDYDTYDGFPSWAQKTLNNHRTDLREYTYQLETFENAKTHDPLWNAAQNEMRKTGKMHGYMRMYWAKKILEWTSAPEEAIKIAIYLNDKYELDGRDPNGYTGIAWAIGGVHDRPWFEREIYGMIRYMNDKGCKRKFDVDKYISSWET